MVFRPLPLELGQKLSPKGPLVVQGVVRPFVVSVSIFPALVVVVVIVVTVVVLLLRITHVKNSRSSHCRVRTGNRRSELSDPHSSSHHN